MDRLFTKAIVKNALRQRKTRGFLIMDCDDLNNIKLIVCHDVAYINNRGS